MDAPSTPTTAMGLAVYLLRCALTGATVKWAAGILPDDTILTPKRPLRWRLFIGLNAYPDAARPLIHRGCWEAAVVYLPPPDHKGYILRFYVTSRDVMFIGLDGGEPVDALHWHGAWRGLTDRTNRCTHQEGPQRGPSLPHLITSEARAAHQDGAPV